MKVYIVYNSTLHLSKTNENRILAEPPDEFVSICGKTSAYDIRNYAKQNGANIYSYAEVKDSKIGNPNFNTDICDHCFRDRRNLNEVPPEFRDIYPPAQGSKKPSSVATDGGEIEEYIENNHKNPE